MTDDDVTQRDPTEDATGVTAREGPGSRPTSRDARLDPGTRIGRYVVQDFLGAGGMGVVYAAFDPELDRKVAIKLLRARPGGSESGGQAWLIREAQAMAKLSHPNVVAVHDVGAMDAEHVFVAMELVDGVTLRKWLAQPRTLTWREVVSVMRAAGTGLAAAHAAGLVHRDFKPDNVVVGHDGRVRVMDFGLARMHGRDDEPRSSDLQLEAKSPLSERLTATGALLGTPAYMAPEVYAGGSADARTDQFAFGVALYEALYRVRPFQRDALVEKRATPPQPPATPKVPAWLERVVLRAIHLDPAQRFATMDELIDELGRDRARGRLLFGAAGALAIGGGAIAVVLAQGSGAPDQRCTDAPDKLARIYNGDARTAMAAAFRKLDRPFVEDAIKGTHKALDGYGASWVAMHTEACKATRVHGDQTEAVLTVRMQCLDERLVELRTLVTLFEHADEPLVRGATAAAQKLSPLADCADTAALLAPDPLPRDPAQRDAIIALGAKLAEARATYKTASRPKDALATLREIEADVMRLDHHPTRARWHFLVGQALWVLEGRERGEPELRKAVLEAESGKADEVKVDAWLQLTNLAIEANNFDVATERLQQASASLVRLGTKWDLKVRVLASEALLASRQNNYDRAIEIAKRAREMAEQHTEAPTQIYATLVESSILNAAARPAEAIDGFRKVLAYHDAFGHRRIEVATTLSTMATAELLLGKVDDAIAHLEDTLSINESIYGRDTVEVARTLSALGAAQGAKGDVATALVTTRRALDLTAKVLGEDNDQYAMTLGQLAGNLIALDKHAEAIPYLDRAEAIQTKALGPSHVQTLTIILTKCDALRAAAKHAEAISTCRRALAIAEKTFGATNPLLFLFFAHTGEALLAGNQPREASTMFESAIAVGATDPSDIAYLKMLDARALWQSKQHARAIEVAREARDELVKLGEAKAELLREVEAWLKTHRLGR